MYMKVINFICFLSLHDVLLISKIVYFTQTVILWLIVIPLAIANAGTPCCLYCILHSPKSLNASLMFFLSLSLFFNLSLSVVHNYTLEHGNKSIHEACIEVDCGPVGFECLDKKAFNEAQSECWCVVVSIALALVKWIICGDVCLPFAIACHCHWFVLPPRGSPTMTQNTCVLYIDHQGHPGPLSRCHHATASRRLSSSIDRHPPSTKTEVDSTYWGHLPIKAAWWNKCWWTRWMFCMRILGWTPSY